MSGFAMKTAGVFLPLLKHLGTKARMAVVALAMAHRLRISLPTDPVDSRERFATSRRQPHGNREGPTFLSVSVGRRESFLGTLSLKDLSTPFVTKWRRMLNAITFD